MTHNLWAETANMEDPHCSIEIMVKRKNVLKPRKKLIPEGLESA